MAARLPLPRTDEDYLSQLRCETASVLYLATKGVPKKIVAAATGRGREYVERQVLGLDPNDLEMICRRVDALLEQDVPREQAIAEVLYLAEAYLWRDAGEELSLALANRLVSSLLRSVGTVADRCITAIDDGEINARERAELNRLIDRLDQASEVLRRAVNSRGGIEQPAAAPPVGCPLRTAAQEVQPRMPRG